jgi:hypothetical protein
MVKVAVLSQVPLPKFKIPIQGVLEAAPVRVVAITPLVVQRQDKGLISGS